ncbi:hypothetical protein SEUBUCD646_0B04890 [Saccharomyces eubayanus]|uniref:Uncharacterized protein n=2 Tax=Saccharomyces TaxID=4930 RepID=A0A6C1E403_SACPS|nr:hypothetical protein GRS66_006176 [Saccharomyces pastorianus]CAI1851153.1 hypothetical protein SEUBUCD650_0B04900 [Saccharomyces eubayanus]CAI1885855.1 hypothetical protein SEUBUCD646_0B04890 [Saccharomyces eubayanus]
MSNPFQNIGKNLLYISAAGIASIYIVKTIVKTRRDAKFTPQARGKNGELKERDYYDNLAQVKPGFPLPKQANNNADGSEDHGLVRKSKYEGSGLSAATRKRGDKLGFLDRRGNE